LLGAKRRRCDIEKSGISFNAAFTTKVRKGCTHHCGRWVMRFTHLNKRERNRKERRRRRRKCEEGVGGEKEEEEKKKNKILNCLLIFIIHGTLGRAALLYLVVYMGNILSIMHMSILPTSIT